MLLVGENFLFHAFTHLESPSSICAVEIFNLQDFLSMMEVKIRETENKQCNLELGEL
jgi:hypothetical protein